MTGGIHHHKMVTAIIPLVDEFLLNHLERLMEDMPDRSKQAFFQAKLENLKKMDAQTRTTYTERMCSAGIPVGTAEDMQRRSDAYWRPFGLWEFERQQALISADGRPFVSHYDFPREEIARGKKAVTLIHETVHRRFPDRVLKPKTRQYIGIGQGFGAFHAYLFPEDQEVNNVLWIEYDQHNLCLTGGFGRSDKNFFTSYALPCWGRYKETFARVNTYEDLEIAIDKFCDVLELVWPYHERFWDTYFGRPESSQPEV